MKPAPARRRPRAAQSDRSDSRDQGVRELTWNAFEVLARDLVGKLDGFQPDVVIGIVKGGLFVGGAVSGLLGCEFFPVRLAARSRDQGGLPAEVRSSIPPEVRGKRVLIVDDVMQSGDTLRRALTATAAAGARQVRSATLVVHKAKPKAGGKRPDWFALETDDLVVFPWDYEVRGLGAFAGAGEVDPGTVGA